MSNLGRDIKKSLHGDEYCTKEKDVRLILPYITHFKKIWCPFDKEDSNFVKTLQGEGFDVVFGHIETGQDFFQYEAPPEGVECIVSNPPFSKRNTVLEKCFSFQIPFALISNYNGLFDHKKRFELFRDNPFELLIPMGRMIFLRPDNVDEGGPNFQSLYICSRLLPQQIVFLQRENQK